MGTVKVGMRAVKRFLLGPQWEEDAAGLIDPVAAFQSWRRARLWARVRLVGLLTVLAAIVSLAWHEAHPFAHAARYLALVGVSLLLSWWPAVLAISVFFGLAWLAYTVAEVFRPGRVRLGRLRAFVVQMNRQIGHVEALLPFVTIAVAWKANLIVQTLLVAAVLALLPDLVSMLATTAFGRHAAASHGNTLWLRRPFYLLLTFAGIVIGTIVLNGDTRLMGLALAFSCGAAVRLANWIVWYQWKGKQALVVSSEARTEFRSRMATSADVVDPAVAWGAMAAAVAVPLLMLMGSGRAAAEDRRARTDGAFEPMDLKTVVASADVALYVIADNQFRELSGHRNGGHVGLVSRIVPVAVRPVELDLLSGVTLQHFGGIYKTLSGWFAGENNRIMPWVHLGDIADLACAGELNRLDEVVDTFGAERLAGIAIGNHDMAFTGNFEWHPDWSDKGACPSGPLRKLEATQAIQRVTRFQDASASTRFPKVRPDQRKIFTTRVTDLGTSVGRKVLGVFLDTTDYDLFRLGIAGVQGSLSQAQERWVSAQLAAQPEALVLFFMHHPFHDLSNRNGKEVIRRLAAQLDDRLLAIVSAHTHLAARRMLPLGDRTVPEFITGSTTDAPQEAAVLTLTSNAGAVDITFATVPAVAIKSGFPRGDLAIAGTTCQEVLSDLKKQAACRPLFGDDRDRFIERRRAAGSECIDRLVEWWPPHDEDASHVAGAETDESRRTSLKRLQGAGPKDIRCMQQDRAARLIACLAHGLELSSSILAHPFDDMNVFAEIEKLTDVDPNRRAEAVCLSWAAGVLHRSPGEGFSTILSTAFDPAATFAAWQTTLQRPQARLATH